MGGALPLDCDWAGEAGKQTYPLFMNHAGVKWPEGAAEGMPITQAHDERMLRQLLSRHPRGPQPPQASACVRPCRNMLTRQDYRFRQTVRLPLKTRPCLPVPGMRLMYGL